jgi:DNA polymerase III epsilon subunit-like protein
MLVIWDTETTGLVKHPDAPLAKQPRLIEFGGIAMSLKDGTVKKRFKKLVHPGEVLSDEITRITGITNEDLEDQPRFPQAWPSILAFLGKATITLAHNEPFDRAVIDYELARIGKKHEWPQTFCTIGLYRERWGRDMKLTELYESVMGKALDQKHRALSDVEALVEIVQAEKLWRALV